MTEPLPLLIPSYNRPNAPLPWLAEHCLKDDYPWWVFVRRSQLSAYSEFVPRRHIVPVEDRLIFNLGETRNYMMKWAVMEGFDQVFDWDDDVDRFGLKLAEGSHHTSFRTTGNEDPWYDGAGYWEEASALARQVFELYPSAVVGSIQNQRWCKTATVQVQCGKTPRRTKILNIDRLVENGLWCPEEFRQHGEDIGNTAMYLENGYQIFTICSLVYSFVSETDVKLPSTLRDRDEEKNKEIHMTEYDSLMNYEIRDYLRVNKAYDDGGYMYGDVDWRKFRKHTGQVSREYEFRPILDHVPLKDIPFREIH